MARYLITGIAGFIGSSLAHELLRQGHDVTGVDNLSGGDIRNLDGIIREIDLHIMDVNETDRLRKCCIGADFLLHQAALASVQRSIDDPQLTHASNVNGTLSVLIAARDARVSRVVYAASSSAYGNKSQQAKCEDMLPDPLSPYAAQKLSGEHLVRSFSRVYGMEGVCLRYFNVFGPRQGADSPYSGAIAKFISMMLKGETPLIFGDGSQSRDFTYIDNVVSANLLACGAPACDVSGQVFNVGGGRSYTLNQTYDLLARHLCFPHGPRYTAPRVGDIQHSEADLTRSMQMLSYVPLASFADGIARTVQWFLTNELLAVS
ncbi:nucleoside-diphosphate-sugar epimerase [Terriglobus roseus DSM 18391]|uniref:Nucleoside-diphosphate-sugar epimerase n=1 Tax=Terriglobus roseus (strain DSM 18391 / NRRL B-41598 / KBS 63) TaxID=926566 RepID=I3ZE79_TERRK|nr:NAD-dependent epimerase/dehydratase family protein [Terriglobus roseus]AFL87547.1 nucleoside-diphosphate-sugar epimerase [Terriglobus roseus DSM 18391]